MNSPLSGWLAGRRNSPRSQRGRSQSCRLAIETLESRLAPAIRTWTGLGADDFWSNAANWDTGVPVDGDDVRIAATAESADVLFDTSVAGSGVTINSLTSDGTNPIGELLRISGDTLTLSGIGTFALGAGLAITGGALFAINDVNIDALNLSGGVLSGAGSVTIGGATTWTGGIMSGSGQTTTNGSLDIVANNSAELDGRTLNINGFTSLTGLSFWRGKNGAVVNNAGLFNLQFDGVILHADGAGAVPTFNNLATGTFRKSAGAGLTQVEFVFNNSGAFEIDTGTLVLNRGGTSTGAFTAAAGATLAFGGTSDITHNLNASSSISAGTVQFSGGTTQFNGGTYNVSGTTQATAGSANFNAGVNVLSVGATLNVSNSFGNLNFSSGEAIQVTTLNMISGTLSGSDNLTISGATTWTGGIMAGSGQTTTNGSLAIQANNSPELAGRTLNINGGASVQAVGGFPNFRANNGAVINNAALFDVQSDATLLHASASGGSGAVPTFINTGTFRKSGGTGVTNVDFVFNSANTVQVNAGTLSLNRGGTSTGNFATTATLAFGGGTHDINANTSGAGTVRLSGGTANLNGGTYNVVGGTQTAFPAGGADAFNFNAGVEVLSVGAALSVAGGTLNFSSGEAISATTLTMSAGVLSGSDNVTISGATSWTQGIIRGGGQITTNGSLSISANNATELDGRTLNINGNTTLTGTSNFRGINGAVINNAGLFDVQSDAVFLHLSGPTTMFNNLASGAFRKSAGAGIATVGFVFNNTGAIELSSGILSLNAGGTSTGDWALAATTEWRIPDATTYLLDGGTDITGAGVVHIQPGATVNAGDAALDLVNVAEIKLTGGLLQGAGALNVSRKFQWDAGTMVGSGTTTILSGATATTSAFADKFLGRTLINEGTFNQTGINFVFGVNNSSATGSINNSGVFNSTNASPIVRNGQSQSTAHAFNNIGTFNRLGTDATQFVGIAFNNTGTVDVQAGALHLDGGGTSSGEFDVAGATLRLGGVQTTLMDTSSITGAGTVEFIGGTTTVDGSMTVSTIRVSPGGTANLNSNTTAANLDLTGGSLQGSGAIAVSGSLNWTAGTMAGSGTTTLLAGATATNPGFGDKFLARTLVNQGTFNHNGFNFVLGVNSSPATGVINNSGVFNAIGGSPIVLNGQSQSTSHAINNSGTFNRSGADLTEIIGIPFSNTGTVNVQAGTLNLAGGLTNFSGTTLTGGIYNVTGTLKFAGANIVTNAATIVLDGTASQIVNSANASGLANFNTNAAAGSFAIQNSVNFAAAAFTNAGAVTIAGGSTFSTAAGDYTQTGGTTTVQGALDPAEIVHIQGGTLAGSGTVLGNTTNAGIVSPGTSPGILTITGNYTQTAAGALNIEVGGTAAGTQFDQLAVSGQATLDGTVNVTRLGGFTPAAADAFRIVSAGSRAGTFATLNGSPFPNGRFTLVHDATGTLLDVNVTPIAVDDFDTTVENHAFTTNVVGNDTDPDGDPLSIIAVGVSTQGVMSLNNGDGTITYTPPLDFIGTDSYSYTIRDSGGNEATAAVTITVTPVNKAPTFDAIPDPAAIPEDADTQTINLTGISAGDGEIQTLTVTAVSSNTFVIPNPAVIYTSPNAIGSLLYTPVANKSGSALITVTVKDNGGTAFGGVDEFTRTFTVSVNAVPEAPTVDTTRIPMLPAIPLIPAPTNPAGSPVADLLDGVTEVDDEPLGIAITGVDNRKGKWEYSLNGGATWKPVPTTVSATTALVLTDDPNSRVRFRPNKGFQGFSNFVFKAWDQSDGAIEETQVDPTLSPTAYSADTERAWVAVGKTIPVVNADGATVLAAVKEDSKFSRTFLVKSLLGIAGLEQLPATNLGMAITGLSTASGKWQFRLAKTTQFIDVGPVSEASALLLRPIDTLRFVPNANADGQAELTFKTWNQVGTAGNKVDTAAPGFGADPGFALIDIAAVNDAPRLDLSVPAVLDPIDPGQTTNEPTFASLMSGTDVEGATLGIAVVATKGQGWEFNTGSGWNPLPIVSTLRALLLNTDAQIRFVAPGNAVPSTATLSFKAWDQFPGSGVVGTRVPIRGTAFSKQTEIVTVAIDNDAPVLNTTPEVRLPNVISNTTRPIAGTLVSSLLATAVTDAAKSLKGIAIVVADNSNGKWQYSIGGSAFVDVGTVSADAALLLTSAYKLRFVPNAGFTGQATIQYKAWDRTAGQAGDRIGTNSGLNSFSLDVEIATVTTT